MSKRSDDDFRAEVEAHIQLEIDQLVAEGMTPQQARKAALKAFGNVTRTRERFYESNRWMWLDHLLRNARYALRQMVSAPISSAAILLSLALGVGLNTSIFSIADQVLIRPLPVDEPDTLFQLEWDGTFVTSGMGSVGFGDLIPYPLFVELSETGLLDRLFARAPAQVHLATNERSIPVKSELVSGNYFEALGVRPALGRLLAPTDDKVEGNHPVAVISHAFWQSQYAARPDILGQPVRLNGTELEIVGVVEDGFGGTDWSHAPAVFLPMMMKEAVVGWSGIDHHRTRFSHVFGRLSASQTLESLEARLAPWFDRYLEADTQREDWPSITEERLAGHLASDLRVKPGARGQSLTSEQIQNPLLILAGATGLVFLLACLNVANLSLARALGARRATALRTALGASRRRILGESLVESGVFALVGGALGALLAPLVSRLTLALLGEVGGGTVLNATLDLRVLGFALAITALLTLLAGAAPALFAASTHPTAALQQRGASSSAGGVGARLRKSFVVGQFALALVLLIGASLFAKTLGKLKSDGPGYSTSNLLSLTIAPRYDGYNVEESKALARRLHERLGQLPEVQDVGLAAFEMLSGGGWNNPVTVQTTTQRVPTDRSLPMNAVTPGFFEALGAPILLGRGFNDSDSHDEGWNLKSVIINQEFMDTYLNGENPVGGRLAFGRAPDAQPSIEIVGVVQSFQDFGLREPEPQVYFALWERTVNSATLYVRASTESKQAMGSIRAALREIDPTLTIVAMRTVDDQLDRLLVSERVLSTLATAFAVLATALAMIGLYGVLSFSAERRRNEIGIRMALGASRWSAGGLLIKEAAWLAGIGLAFALPAIWGLGRLIESQLFGVKPMDLVSILGAAAVLCLAVFVASAQPANKLSRVDPIEALRAE